MHLTIKRKDLSRLVTATKGAADPKSAVPALKYILFTAAESLTALSRGSLTAAATDLYRAAWTSAECEVRAAGSIALPAAELAERVKVMPEGPVDILITDNGARVELRAVGTKRRYALPCLPAAEFPALPHPAEGAVSFALSAELFASLASRAAFSMSTDTSRVNTSAALIEWSRAEMRMVSTDGHRLTHANAVAALSAPGSMLVPSKAIDELRRLTDGEEGEVVITPGDPWVFVKIDSLTFGFKVSASADAFPPYQQVIPAPTRGARVKREAMLDALRGVRVAAADKTGSVRVGFAPGALVITAESAESGTGSDEVEADYSGPAFVAEYNASYLIEPLSAIDADEVEITSSGAMDPLAIRPVGKSDYVAVVMPMRI